MIAYEFEYRHRHVIIVLVYALAYACYNLDTSNPVVIRDVMNRSKKPLVT